MLAATRIRTYAHTHLKWREERRGIISWTVCRSRRVFVFSKRVAEKVLDIVFHLLSHRLAILLVEVLIFRKRLVRESERGKARERARRQSN